MDNNDSVKITILYDNNCLAGFKASWGFSCLIETNENTIIFDTGWDGNVLLHNLELSQVNIEKIDLIVLSHSHWDHIGGLTHILPLITNPKVVLLKSFSENMKREIRARAEILEIVNYEKIMKGVWTTGELGDKIKEQALVVEIGKDKGNILLTGCAHPDLKSIIQMARTISDGDLKAIIGGFHDSEELNMLEGIERVIPCHCTQKMDEIKIIYPDSYLKCAAGQVFNFP